MKNIVLASLICCSGSAFAQLGWQHVGLAGAMPTTGVQFVSGELLFHPTGNSGRLYRTVDGGVTWDSTQFSAIGRSWKYAEHDGVEFLSYYNGYSGGTRLFRFNAGNGQWQQKYLVVDGYEVLPSGRIVLLSGITGENFPVRISDNGGDSWTTTFPSSGAIRFRSLGKDAEGRLLLQTYDWDNAPADSLGLWRSADEGLSWSRISDIQYDLTGASITNDGHIYCSNGRRILHSSDNGETWDEPWEVDFAFSGFNQSAVYHVGGGRLYFMRQFEQWNDPRNLYYSADGGHTWEPVTDEVTDHLAINMTQDDSGNLYVATSNGVYRQQLATAVEPMTANDRIALVPNPAHGSVRLNSSGDHVHAVRLMDVHSRLVRAYKSNPMQQTTIDLNGVTPGVYLLEAMTQQGSHTMRLVVE